MLLSNEEHEKVWDNVYAHLHFRPTIDTTVIPFVISEPHVVYDISKTNEVLLEPFHDLITNALIRCTPPGQQLYALEWHHCSFLFDPRDPQQMQSQYIKDSRHFGGGYHAFFPEYYPDGDYYFFLDTQFRFGYLGHPWRKEVWIFGNCLISEFDKIYKQLGWTVKEDLG